MRRDLTDGQTTCLRLVGRGMSSKEIAAETGLSPQTVDTYIKAAMARLGASNRREAARMLSSSDPSQELGSLSQAIAALPVVAQQEATAGAGAGAQRLLPPLGGRLNHLGTASRIYAMMRVSAFSAVMVIAIALFMAGAFRAFR